ncbi:hypothetical protein EJ03DRAFT_338731 [Teratosphaeria nubilosa]|uniref:DUF7703 domain-containing protein n=1 Tax=Teratosphaeria nubilosa TaxID=161662 RepID=A0A6G1L0F5_9PEZI|nr:hypothetical protein EJ03DRAFT_338731 [Teratosphaeria nubilosa]
MSSPHVWYNTELSASFKLSLIGRRGLDGKTVSAIHTVLCGLTAYNAILVVVMVFFTFTRYRGMYFWSLLLAAFGTIPSQFGHWVTEALCGKGNLLCWWLMVTGQACVLWSRLHLVLHGSRGYRILRWTKWMIISNAILLHVPSSVLLYCPDRFPGVDTGYRIMNKIQMVGFFLQETTLSSIYILEAIRVLRSPLRPLTLTGLRQLIIINAVIIVMDLGLLGVEMASLHTWQITMKPLIYSTKLLLECAILGKIVNIMGGNRLSEEPGRQAARPISFAPKQSPDGARTNAASTGNIVPECSNVTVPTKASGIGRAGSQTFIRTGSDIELEVALSRQEDNISALRCSIEPVRAGSPKRQPASDEAV